MKKAYDPCQPIKVIFVDQYKDAIDLAAATNTAYTPAQIITYACKIILQNS
jgi:hypothetical protein